MFSSRLSPNRARRIADSLWPGPPPQTTHRHHPRPLNGYASLEY